MPDQGRDHDIYWRGGETLKFWKCSNPICHLPSLPGVLRTWSKDCASNQKAGGAVVSVHAVNPHAPLCSTVGLNPGFHYLMGTS
jgi:hypothetical protein